MRSSFNRTRAGGRPWTSDIGLGMTGDFPAQAQRMLIVRLYEEADGPLRARMLECLLRPLGPLALVAVANGAFGAFVHRRRWHLLRIHANDTLEVRSDQLQELAEFALAIDAGVLARIESLLEFRLGKEAGPDRSPTRGQPRWQLPGSRSRLQ
ncbi:hypothetical protein [Azohydromonas aeria]|uniref:hypothetical protein n=1 Tax=Azohydromonas aeria TaxID=2590212 RepID=UPI0012FC1175|nr:hypothetical protein [Azohydromonas aeria]